MGDAVADDGGVGLGVETADHQQGRRRLNMLVARHWIGVNDVFSYRKELYSGDTMNEIHLALADNGGNRQAAVDRIAATVHRVEAEFDETTARLRVTPAGKDSGLLAYLDALEVMIAGNLEWSYLTPATTGSATPGTARETPPSSSPLTAPSTCRTPTPRPGHQWPPTPIELANTALPGPHELADDTENEARFLDCSRTRSWTVEVRVS